MRRILLSLGILTPILAWACYNDRDTLGFELSDRPDLQRALTGRFDRYPPLYYKMRVDRLRSKGKLTPAEYDDMAVALGRLGRNDEALAALAKKAALPHLTLDEQYRLYANRGTIEAHRWIQQGGIVADLSQMKAAERDIAKALEINPNAHFGREGTQLEVIRWIIDVKSPRRPKNRDPIPLSKWLLSNVVQSDKLDLPTTLSGLVMLGGAWESPDVALAIGRTSEDGIETPTLAYQRYKELIKMGRKPIDADLAAFEVSEITKRPAVSRDDRVTSTADRFVTLRKEADAWHDGKTRFMMDRLAHGRHPDTDPTFWNGWKETPMPKLPTELPKSSQPLTADDIFRILVGIAVVVAGILISIIWIGKRARRAAR
jgi:tetratricopeptide (TPR) repeat protein